MTAEIAVMNEEAVALAADSAVSGPKIFTSANKIFALSKYHPVAIMINDSARFLGVPWETIIKAYRVELGERSFPTLAKHAAHFLSFFDEANPLFPANGQVNANAALFASWFEAILLETDRRIEERLAKGRGLTSRQIAREAAAVINEAHGHLAAQAMAPSLPSDHAAAVRRAYGATIEREIAKAFKKLPLTERAREQLRELAGALVSVDAPVHSPCHSGVIIAGFGQQEHFPSLHTFGFDTIALNRLKYTQEAPTRVRPDEYPAAVVAFAQHEQVATFMHGIDTSVADAITAYWREMLPELVSVVADRAGLDRAAKERLEQDMSDWCARTSAALEGVLERRRAKVNEPILRVVAMMPKDELAAMAESLVNLTSFKRKVTEEAETVGGPIDVAVISKGDGLIWVKRKHYFQPELNPQFFANYYPKERK
jgi:hypothetical protein